MKNYIDLDYIQENEVFVWSTAEIHESGLKGVVANDLDYDYEMVKSVKLISSDGVPSENAEIKTWVATVEITEKLTYHFIVKAHYHADKDDYTFYYVKL